jgi:hypothetical protein
MTGADTARIRELNDQARQSFSDCRVLVTPGVLALDATDAILQLVRQYSTFTPDNDPYAEHDFGSFRYGGETIFWKFDYYDLDLTMHSLDAADPAVTARVLTVLLGSEY